MRRCNRETVSFIGSHSRSKRHSAFTRESAGVTFHSPTFSTISFKVPIGAGPSQRTCRSKTNGPQGPLTLEYRHLLLRHLSSRCQTNAEAAPRRSAIMALEARRGEPGNVRGRFRWPGQTHRAQSSRDGCRGSSPQSPKLRFQDDEFWKRALAWSRQTGWRRTRIASV